MEFKKKLESEFMKKLALRSNGVGIFFWINFFLEKHTHTKQRQKQI